MGKTKQGTQGSVFISYSRKDKAFVKKLNDALDNSGIKAWVDWEGIELASDWMETISTAIKDHDAFIFVISPDSLKSKVCIDELNLSLKFNKKLIPILYREPTKTSKMHEKLRATNWVYLRKQDDFDATIPKLVESIQTDLEWVSQNTQLLGQALEWEGKEKNNNFLLGGTKLQDAEHWMADASGKENREILPLQAEYISASRTIATRNQRRLTITMSLLVVAAIAFGVYAFIARGQAQQAERAARVSEAAAIESKNIADIERENALAQEKIAKEQQAIAEDKTNIANAQKSAAQSQIYQSRSGELGTSTLLAIDSFKRLETFEAENLIRSNIGKLAMPINQMSQDGAIWNIEWSPDYEFFVTGNNHDPANSEAVTEACVWRAKDGEKIYCVQHENDVNDALFTDAGDLLITASADQTVKFWNANDGTFIKELKFDGAVNDLDVSDSVLAIARADNFLTLYYLYKPDVKPVNREEKNGVYSVKFSPNNLYLAYGLTNGDVKFWQALTNAFYNGPKHPKSNFIALAFSPDDNWLVSAGGDSMARLTRRDGSQQYAILHGDWVEDVAFGPDPSWYVTVSDDNKVRILDTATGTERLRMSHANFVQKVKVSPDGQWIASTGYDRVVRIWDAASGSQMLEIPLSARGSAISFNQDGTRIVAVTEAGRISIWDISILKTRASYIVFSEFVHEARFTPSGDSLIVNTDDYNIWKIPADQVSQIKDGTQGEILVTTQSLTYNTAVSPDSLWLAAVELDSINAQLNQVTLVSLDGKSLFQLQHGGQVTGVTFSSDSSLIATSGSDGLINFWDVKTGKKSFDFNNSEKIFSLAADPTGSLVAAGLHDNLVLWDINTREMLGELQQTGDVVSLVFNKEGNILASGSSEGSVILWKVEDGALTQIGDTLNLNGRPVSFAFSPNNQWLAGGGSGGYAYLWDVATTQEMARIAHTDPVTGITFSLDGTKLYTVSRKVVNEWDIESIQFVAKNDLIPFACLHLTQNLSSDDWSTLIGKEPYQPICADLPVGQ